MPELKQEQPRRQRRGNQPLFAPQAAPEVAARHKDTPRGVSENDQTEFAEKGPFSGSRLRKLLAAHHPIILAPRIRPHLCTVRVASMGQTVTADCRKGDADLIPGLQLTLVACGT